MRLTHTEVEAIRRARGRSLLLFITDRCPVGCDHCSVDSRSDGPTIDDFALFEQIVEWIAGRPELEVIGISGGEPFVERRGLELATRRLAAAGKQLVVFTSGVWARREQAPAWIDEVLQRCACAYLSTDDFHAANVELEYLFAAIRTLARAQVWIVLQLLDVGDAAARGRALLQRALGSGWAAHAEINLIAPLSHGRGAEMFVQLARSEGRALRSCSLVRSPMIRYDGTIIACCNESVIRGGGPTRLRRQADSQAAVGEAVAGFHADALLRAIGDVGLGVLTEHPRFADLAQRRFADNCQLCWQLLERMGDDDDPLIDAIAALAGARAGAQA